MNGRGGGETERGGRRESGRDREGTHVKSTDNQLREETENAEKWKHIAYEAPRVRTSRLETAEEPLLFDEARNMSSTVGFSKKYCVFSDTCKTQNTQDYFE